MSKSDDKRKAFQSADIATRLRESNGMTTSRSSDGFMSIHPDTDLMREAADEIERLRAEVARLGSFLHPIGTAVIGQAVRGD